MQVKCSAEYPTIEKSGSVAVEEQAKMDKDKSARRASLESKERAISTRRI